MSRKRKDQETSSEIGVADPQGGETIGAVTFPDAEAPTAVAEQPPAENAGNGQSFADRVGQKKKWVPDPDPFEIASDNQAGVRLYLSKRDRQMAIMFGDGSPKDKPSQPVIDKMREAECEWKSKNRVWGLAFTPETERRAHIEAERLFQEVCQMIRQEKGITQEIPF